MFICQTCTDKDEVCHGKSWGPCEVCGVTGECFDVEIHGRGGIPVGALNFAGAPEVDAGNSPDPKTFFGLLKQAALDVLVPAYRATLWAPVELTREFWRTIRRKKTNTHRKD